MKKLILAVVLMLSACAATPISNKHSVYNIPDNLPVFSNFFTGDVATVMCAFIEDNEALVLKAPGGWTTAGFAIARCIHDKNLTIAVKEAYSAAPILMFAAAKVCLYPDAKIGFHQPNTELYFNRGMSMPQERLEAEYDEWRFTLRKIGISDEVIEQYIAFMDISPNHINHRKMTIIPHGMLIKMLGNKFVGYCKEIPESGITK